MSNYQHDECNKVAKLNLNNFLPELKQILPKAEFEASKKKNSEAIS